MNERALLSVKPEEVNEWKKKYKFENVNPSYLGPFYPLVKAIIESVIEQNFGKIWKKRIESGNFVCFYQMVPLKIRNAAAEIDTDMEILVPIIYEVNKKEIKIDAMKCYELARWNGKIEDLDERDEEVLNEAKEELKRSIPNIKDKIRSNIEKVKIEIEELALQRQREEIARRIEEKRKKLEILNREINRRRSSGLKYDKEITELQKKAW